MKNFVSVAVFTILFIAFVSCAPEKSTAPKVETTGKPTVACVNYPLAFFAEKIGGDDVDVLFPEIDGDPAFWKPTDAQIAQFQNADLILRNGATYAKWAETVSLPAATQIDTAKAFTGALIQVKETGAHTHGNGDVHAHAGIAFTTWLDFENTGLQADAIAKSLAQRLPEESNAIATRAANLREKIDTLDAEITGISQKLKDQPLVASHPVYQYLAKAYGLKIKSVHWEPEVVPDEKAIAELQKILIDHDAKVMIWEDEPAPESVAKLKALGIKSIVFNPCGNRPKKGDFLSVMEQNLKNLRSLTQ